MGDGSERWWTSAVYPAERLKQIRELELYLFGGIPETPEPMHERDLHAWGRDRAPRSFDGRSNASDAPAESILGFVEYDPHTRDIRFVTLEQLEGE